MVNPSWRRPWLRWLLAALTVAVMIMIFGFSAQDGEKSNGLSARVVDLIIRVVSPGYDQMAPETQLSVYDALQFVVRKFAHFSEYALLGFLMRLLAHTYPWKRRSPWAWLAGTLYAGTDELHQLFVGDRTAMIGDVGIDSAGVLTGVLVGLLLALIIDRAYIRKHSQKS